MITDCIFKGVSASSLGLVMRSVDRELFPQLTPRTATISGRHGVIDYGENTFTERAITIKFTHKKQYIPMLVAAQNEDTKGSYIKNNSSIGQQIGLDGTARDYLQITNKLYDIKKGDIITLVDGALPGGTVLAEKVKVLSDDIGGDGYWLLPYNTLGQAVSTVTVYVEEESPSMYNSNTLRKISEWLYTEKKEELIFTDEPSKKYFARVYDATPLRLGTAIDEFTVKFYCEPFAIEKNVYSFPTNLPYEIFNLGVAPVAYTSQQGAISRLKIKGMWNANLKIKIESVGGKTTELIYAPISSNPNNELEIDNVNMTIKINGVNALQDTTGDLNSFLILESGLNKVSFTNALTAQAEFEFTELHI